MKRCDKCGGRRRKIKTEVNREVEGQSLRLAGVPAYWCPTCAKVEIIEPELLTKDKPDLAMGINKLYFTHRYVYYSIGVLILAAMALSLYIFIVG